MVSFFRIRGDTLQIAIDREAIVFRFFGQNGKFLEQVSRSTKANYILKPQDTYIRTTIVYATSTNNEGITLYLNPVVRTTDGKRPKMVSAIVDLYSTWVYRIIGFATVFFVGFNVVYLRRKLRKHRC